MTDTSRRSGRTGRPKGATRYAQMDQETLVKIAELVTDAKLPLAPTTAMRRLGIHDSSAHRRLQRKWAASAPQLEEAVRERRRAASTTRTVSRSLSPDYSIMGQARAALELQMQLRDAIDPPALRAVREHFERQQRLNDLIDPPGTRAFRRQMEEAQRLQGLLDPSYLRAFGIFR